MTVGEALRQAGSAISSSPTPHLDAEVLMAAALQRDREWLLARTDRPLEEPSAGAYRAMVESRQAGVPVAYLTGRQEFYGRTFQVNPDVLVPRPDSESVIEACLTLLRPGDRLVDVGAGSGCLGLTLALEYGSLGELHLVDIDRKALDVSRRNARRLGVSARFHQANLLPSNLPIDDRTAVVANLPYVSDDDYHSLPGLRHEPALALLGGPDGMRLIRRLLQRLGGRPRTLVMEIDPSQVAALESLGPFSFMPDRSGRTRVAVLAG